MKPRKCGRYAALGLALIAISTSAFAQDAISFLNEANTQVRSAGTILYQVVMAILCLCAIVSLIMVAVRMMSADRDGVTKALAWSGGLLFCILMALVIKNFMGI